MPLKKKPLSGKAEGDTKRLQRNLAVYPLKPEKKPRQTIKTENSRIAANAFWMVFDKIFIVLLNLIVTVKVANHYGKLTYGGYEYAGSVIAILEILVTFVDGRVVKKCYQNYEESTVVYNATICRMLFSALSAVIGVVYLLFSGRDRVFAIMFILLLVNAILTNLRFGMINRFEYQLKSKKVVIAADVSALLGGVLQLLAVHRNWIIGSISLIACITSAMNLLIVYLQYRKQFRGETKGKFERNLVVEMTKESLPLAIAASCATIYTRCDSVMLGSMLSDAAVGVYAIAVKMIAVVQIAANALKESVFPRMMVLHATDRERYAREYVRITSFLTWLCAAGIAVSYVILPYILQFFSDDYVQSFSVYKLLVISCVFTYNASLRAGHFTLIGRGDILMKVQIFSMLMNIVLNIAGIKMWGVYGAALATVITQGVSLFVSNVFFGKDGREVFRWQMKAFNPIHILR